MDINIIIGSNTEKYSCLELGLPQIEYMHVKVKLHNLKKSIPA